MQKIVYHAQPYTSGKQENILPTFFTFRADLSVISHMQMPLDKNPKRKIVGSVSGCQVSRLA